MTPAPGQGSKAGGSSGWMGLLASAPLALPLALGQAEAPEFAREPSPPPAASREVPSSAETTPPSAYCVYRFTAAFRTMAGLGPEASDGGGTETWLDRVSAAATELARTFGNQSVPATVESMIATVPDPVDTGLSYQFDTHLRALRRGFEHPLEHAFYRDRSWLPWDDREVPASRRKESEECRISTPGVVLFRNENPRSPRVYALLLVGESPTSGLRQSQMRSALDVQARLDSLPGQSAAAGLRPVRILGPSFSGSAQSLRLSLANWSRGSASKQEFQVLSGTATGSAVPEWLSASGLSGGSQIRFAATVAPEATAECSYLWFLNNRLDVVPESGFDAEIHASTRGVPLAGVATLSESGTEFGATVAEAKRPIGSAAPGSSVPSEKAPLRNPSCRWAASSNFHFPFHISVLRDAYEVLDRRDSQAQKDVTIARATGLEVSLRESRTPLEIEANSADKTSAAEDTALGNLIERLAMRRIRHVAIHATDVGDAIFLARRIRDVAPDVRIAFFGSDALLLHPEFRREVLGSLVVSSYPFLGLSEFESGAGAPGPDRPRPVFEAFENGSAQGVYNAVLAQRGAPPHLLSEYMLGSQRPLPVWISTIGRGRLIPIQVRSTLDCSSTLYRNPRESAGAGGPTAFESEVAVCRASSPADARAARARFKETQTAALHLQPHATRPRLWDFLFAILCFGFLLDGAHQNVIARRFAPDTFPDAFEPANDQQLDRAIARTKCRLYATVRSFLFLLAFSYMGILYLLEFVARVDPSGSHAVSSWPSLLSAASVLFGFGAIAGAVVAALLVTRHSARRFLNNYREFRACVFSAPRLRQTVPERLALGLGLRHPRGRHEVAHTSFSQLRVLTWLSLGISCFFLLVLVGDTLKSADWLESWRVDRVPRLTLTAMRNMDLTSGVSPSTPALLCMLCVYVWAVSRMLRLALAHSTSRASPPDGETDLVSTPIRLILYPGRTSEGAEDAGFTQVERDVANAIWRPIMGRLCVTATLGVGFFPIVLFTLKPFSTLEGWFGSAFLGGGLALSVFLIGVTLVQEVQHWLLLQRLLKRTMEHALGPAFAGVPSFARDSVDHQVSRSPNDLLRWAACARMFHDLVRSLDAAGEFEPIAGEQHALAATAAALCRARTEALAGGALPSLATPALDPSESSELTSTASESADAVPSSSPLSREEDRARGREEGARTALEAKLAEGVIAAASRLTQLLERAWRASAVLPTQVSEVQEAGISGQVEISRGALAVPVSEANQQILAVAGDAWRPLRAVATVAGSGVPPSAPAERARAPHSEPSVGKGPCDALTPLESVVSSAQLAWLRAAQTFVATVVTLLIQRHVRQFRYFLAATTLCGLLLLLAVSSYPFEPHRLILTFIWIVILSVAGAGLWTFVQMDRNTLMSHISGTAPNEVTFDGQLVLRILVWAIVPLLGVAAAQYPELANYLFRVIRPFASALH